MAGLIKKRFISPEMTDDSELATEAAERIAEDLTFLKLDGSRPMQGNLDVNNNDASNIKKLQSGTVITKPSYTVAVDNGVLLLDSNSTSVQFVTGIQTGYSIMLPDATTLQNGTNFELYNRTNNPVMVKYNDGTELGVLDKEAVTSLILQSNATTNGIFSPFTVEIAQAAGILSYNLDSQVAFATSSAVDEQVTGFTITPISGRYAIFMNCDATSKNNNAFNTMSLYKNGVQISGTERVNQSVSSNFEFPLSLQAVASFNGTEELRVYARVSSGIFTINSRSILMLRLGPEI